MGDESTVIREESSVKKVRAAAVIAVVTTVVSQARDYARENPDQAAETVDQVERFLRGKLPPTYGAYVGKGGALLRQGLGLAPRAGCWRLGCCWADRPRPGHHRTACGARLPRPGGAQPVAGHERRPPAAPVGRRPGTADAGGATAPLRRPL